MLSLPLDFGSWSLLCLKCPFPSSFPSKLLLLLSRLNSGIASFPSGSLTWLPSWVLSWSPFLFLFLYLEHCVLRLWTCLSSSRSWKDSREGLWLTPPLCVSINTCGMNEWETGERKKGKEALLLFFHLRKRGVNMPLLKKKARRRGWSHSTNKSRGLSSSYLPFSSCHNKELQNCLLRLCKLS